MRNTPHRRHANEQAANEPVMDKVWYVLAVFTLCAAPSYGIGMFLAAAALAVTGLLASAHSAPGPERLRGAVDPGDDVAVLRERLLSRARSLNA